MSSAITVAPPVGNIEVAMAWIVHWNATSPRVLTAIVPDGGGIETAAFLPGEEDQMAAWILSRNANANVYFAVNSLLPSFIERVRHGKGVGVKAKKADVAQLDWIHADIDPAPRDPTSGIEPQVWFWEEGRRSRRRLYSFRPRPTAIINSGLGGVQAFHKIADPFAINGDTALAEYAEGYNRGIAVALNSDHVQNCDRIMRLPGTINWPDAKKRAKGRVPWPSAIAEFFPDRTYLRSAFANVPAHTAVVSPAGTAMVPTAPRASTRLDSIDDLDRYALDGRAKAIIIRAKMVIVQGRDHDNPKPGDDTRSAWVWDVLCQLARVGVPDDVIHGTVTDPNFAISESLLKRPDAVWRRIDEAKAAVAQDHPGSGRSHGNPNGIVMRAGELNEILNEAESALLVAGVPIYQRSELVRLSTVNKAKTNVSDGISRAEGARVLAPVTDRWLLQQMAHSISWSKPNKKGEMVTADPTLDYAKHLLARSGEWPFPVLKGLASAPTLGRDGVIIEKPGYDGGSGLYLDFAAGAFPPIPEKPTLQDARRAMEKINHLLRGFPFANDVSRAVALSAILTALIRPSLRTAPIHGIDSPAAGSGKSMVAEIVGIIATGNTPAAMSQGKDDEEDEKRLSVCLRSGDPIIWIDNCERPVQGDFLCSVVTQETVQARILGKSERVVLPSQALIVATGNNLEVAGDASRRLVMCRLDAKMERPDTRAFDWDCRDEAKEQRAELVVAALTALRAYRLSGAKIDLQPMGSFVDWDWVRGTLVWTGYADPAASRDGIVAADRKKDALAGVMEDWDAINKDRPVKLSKLDVGKIANPGAEQVALAMALMDAAECRRWDGVAIAGYLRRNRERIIRGRRFAAVETIGGRAQWALEFVNVKPEQKSLNGL